MKQTILLLLVAGVTALGTLSFRDTSSRDAYAARYFTRIGALRGQLAGLCATIRKSRPDRAADLAAIRDGIRAARLSLKEADFWLRYLEPTVYKKLNGPLPVEWETEVFEKFEAPYRREGAGLTLAAQYLDEPGAEKAELLRLVQAALDATNTYVADSVTRHLAGPDHFYYCNRLFLLNLAAIYTTGFECPDTAAVIPELRHLLHSTAEIYTAFNAAYPATALPAPYLALFRKTLEFVDAQPSAYSTFDHFTFLQACVGPLYTLNQHLVRGYGMSSRSLVDYSLNKENDRLFSKSLYNGQNAKGIFLRVRDEAALAELKTLGRLLFYDPLLSGNNQRSCASCHKPEQCFTDTTAATALRFDRQGRLGRNTPTLVNAGANHLIMADGRQYTLQQQIRAVITDRGEMNCPEEAALRKVLSCATYRNGFTRLLRYTPQEPEITMEHIASAITWYYAGFSSYAAPFDAAMDGEAGADAAVVRGFNLFMSKAQCATCHFVPLFNGVKPPYVGSEFEVLGVPADTAFRRLSPDKGRYAVNPAAEMQGAFRTGTVRNAGRTAPYMHNGVFSSLEQLVDFYDHGGGAGRGLTVENQTLSADSLGLTRPEKADLIRFIRSLDEAVVPQSQPERLPRSSINALNRRKAGGLY